jgi:hypothetical protein
MMMGMEHLLNYTDRKYGIILRKSFPIKRVSYPLILLGLLLTPWSRVLLEKLTGLQLV